MKKVLKPKILKPKVLIITVDQSKNPMKKNSEGEALRWVQRSKINKQILVPGLPHGLYHNRKRDQCMIITGEGGINGAVALGTLLVSGIIDLSDAYILISGIGGGNPERMSVGSVAWAHWVVSSDLAQMVEMEELPTTFSYPYFPLGGIEQWSKNRVINLDTQVYKLNTKLANQALRHSKNVKLTDSIVLKKYRENYPYPAAKKPPSVLQGDIMAGNTFYVGNKLGAWAEFWMLSWTKGQGKYAAVNLEDNAIVGALKRFSEAGKLDFNRVLVSRSPANYERPHTNQSALEGLKSNS